MGFYLSYNIPFVISNEIVILVNAALKEEKIRVSALVWEHKPGLGAENAKASL